MNEEKLLRLPVPLATKMLEYGWIVTGVPSIGIAYTVGLMEKFNHPEIAIHGLPVQTSYGFLQSIVKMIRDGKRFEPGQNYDEIAANFPTQFVVVDRENASWVGMVYNYNGPMFNALQMIWTDTKGKFPWEPDFEERFRDKQHVLNVPVPYPESGDSCCDANCACNSKNNPVH
jgi:hypothetical protein